MYITRYKCILQIHRCRKHNGNMASIFRIEYYQPKAGLCFTKHVYKNYFKNFAPSFIISYLCSKCANFLV